jgi:hypothetical protein
MPNRLRLSIYKRDPVNYRYILHGGNPSIRGRFRTATPLTGASELTAIKNALHALSPRLESYIANLKLVA